MDQANRPGAGSEPVVLTQTCDVACTVASQTRTIRTGVAACKHRSRACVLLQCILISQSSLACRWGPLNLLVYMGLRHPKYADVPEIQAARKQLAVQSREAMMVEWLPKHHVHENLNPDTGLGDDVGNSNPMYGSLHMSHPCLVDQLHSLRKVEEPGRLSSIRLIKHYAWLCACFRGACTRYHWGACMVFIELWEQGKF